VRNLIRNVKKILERKLATENGVNSRPFYEYLKSKTKSRTAVGPLMNKKQEVVADKKEMVAMLNRYFSSVFTVEPDGPVPAPEPCETAAELHTVEINLETVFQKIKALKLASAPGLNGNGSLVLRELAQQLVAPLTAIFRKSLEEGQVPADWKMANVTPIQKKGLVCCSLLESIIRDGMVDHMFRNNLIEESQHGFVMGRSCETNLVEFFDHISEVLEGGGKADAIFLDCKSL
jgi:hypothetical protein